MKPTFHVVGIQTQHGTQYAVSRHLDGRVLYQADRHGRLILGNASHATLMVKALDVGTGWYKSQFQWIVA